MADRTAPEDDRTGRPRSETRRGAVRPLLALASVLPLALAVASLATLDAPETVTAPQASAQSAPGASTRWCYGPMELPEEALAEGTDSELAVTPPSPDVSLRTVSVEPASSLLFGRVSASQTLQEEDGSVRAPSIDAVFEDGTSFTTAPVSEDMGVTTLRANGVKTPSRVSSMTSAGERPVTDTIQGALTRVGDYRSLSLTRCTEPSTSASFLGVSTARGNSSVLVLHNRTDRPATASVQIRTEDGPARMDGRSQIVVAPGEEQRVLLESVAAGHEAIGVEVDVLGAPLSMHVQTTERNGLTPGGAEILSPLPQAATEQVMPGVDVAGTPPTLVLANGQGSATSASVEVIGPQGVVEAAGIEALEVPAGTVTSTALDGLPDGTYTVIVRSQDPLAAVTRSVRTGADLPGDTIGSPVDFALVVPAPAIGSHAVTALPGQGAAGQLTLVGSEASAVTVIPVGADGSAGAPVEVEVDAGRMATLTSDQLAVAGGRPAGITVVPEVPGSVFASWTQREGDGASGILLSTLPVLSVRGGQDPVTVRLAP